MGCYLVVLPDFHIDLVGLVGWWDDTGQVQGVGYVTMAASIIYVMPKLLLCHNLHSKHVLLHGDFHSVGKIGGVYQLKQECIRVC